MATSKFQKGPDLKRFMVRVVPLVCVPRVGVRV